MSMTEAVELFQRTLWLGLLVAAPMLLFGLVTGLLVSILQAV
ncbi:MAG: EscS/YscS/HrcS family type III secretion system export apparatus protein, partial [Candidatus Eisenbacteria bacterium]|nr:EscS/YscS/HrcS family type III secretion system export apparatus protein [Candidatus Eisenbacteria bacterium]